MSNQPSKTAYLRPFSKILCIAALALAASTGAAAARPPSRPPREEPSSDLLRADLSQRGEDLVFAIRTEAPLPLASLDRLPATESAGSRFLCLALSAVGRRSERRLCLGGSRNAHRKVGLELIDGAGKTTKEETLAARLKRPSPDKLVLTLLPAETGLAPHRYRWQVLENRSGCGGCTQSLPSTGTNRFRLRPVRAVGCTGGSAGLLTNGPRDRNVVALTFDDGPSTYTEGFLDVLREKHVHGTFFEIGVEMPGREQTMRRILREGDEIGDHTMHHVEYPGSAEIAGAAARIEDYTHFKPCLFRPPGGAVDSSVIATAGSLGMKTITWDVDPTDWATPGSAAVYNRVVEATQPGSIVLMHDGGGDRSGTLAALPSIIDTLRARGYRFATVTELLGQRMLYRPYG